MGAECSVHISFEEKAEVVCEDGCGPIIRRRRHSIGTSVGVRCAERRGCNKDSVVRLVVFDLDETLTLTTFMSDTGRYSPDQYGITAKINFESPWLEGSRIESLKQMLAELKRSRHGHRRTLAVLTRNNNPGGVEAVVNLLNAAGLAEHFSAIWSMPWRLNKPNGAYLENGRWKYFDPPLDIIEDHKAEVLHNLCEYTADWFPNLGEPGGPSLPERLKPEELVLVDDQRSNFQSDRGTCVPRYCKVARYDANYYDFGFLSDMGGIGAHDPRDFALLTRFVEDPSDFEASLTCSCSQLDDSRRPVHLVVFDFDETLTLGTFLPEDAGCRAKVGWQPGEDSDWSAEELVQYNFESPWLSSSRVQKLKALLSTLAEGRMLAVLTRSCEPVAALNLLQLAGLAEHFAAIWRVGDEGREGLKRTDNQWARFETPASEGELADVLASVVDRSAEWLPRRVDLEPSSVVLVDDERANFWSSDNSGNCVLRRCKVARYDEEYRDCGVLANLGGLAAHCEEDLRTLRRFVDEPWQFPCRDARPPTITQASLGEKVAAVAKSRVPMMRRMCANMSDEPVSCRRRVRPAR